MGSHRIALLVSALCLAAAAAIAPAQENVWVSNGPTGVSIGALALDPQSPSTIWAGGIGDDPSSGPGLFRSTDNGSSWSPAGGPQGPPSVKALLIDSENPQTIYAGWDTVFRSDDDGATWTSSVIPGSEPLTALAIDPTDSRRVWASTWPGSLRRTSQGAWSRRRALASSKATGPEPGVTHRSHGPSTPFSSTSGAPARSMPDLTRRSEACSATPFGRGAPFSSATTMATPSRRTSFDFGTSAGGVQSIVADPFHPDAVYVSDGGCVFRGNDRGVSLQSDGGMHIRRIVADPVRPGRLYGTSSSAGVARSEDGARTWHPFSEGLPPDMWAGLPPTRVGTGLRAVSSTGPLVISPDGRWLYVGTGSAGVFARDLGAPEPCAASATRLCLVANRYAVDVFASRPGENPYSPGTAHSLGDRAGYFGLPAITGDPELPEIFIKMLPAGTFGGSAAPVFYASLTTLPYTLIVTDTTTGNQRVYTSDTEAPLCGDASLAFGAQGASAIEKVASRADDDALELLDGRFSVTLEAVHPRSGAIAPGVAMLSGDRFGIFSLPAVTGDSQFPEVVVKMVDARSFWGTFWFFHTGLTSLEYTLTVTDFVTGDVQVYGKPGDFCGGADTSAFTD